MNSDWSKRYDNIEAFESDGYKWRGFGWYSDALLVQPDIDGGIVIHMFSKRAKP